MRINTVSAGIALGLALVSCNMNPTPQKSALTTLGIQKFEGWPGTVDGFQGQVDLKTFINKGIVSVTSVPVNAKGEFTLALPALKDDQLTPVDTTPPAGCTSTLKVSDTNFLLNSFVTAQHRKTPSC